MIKWLKKSDCEFMSMQYTTILKGIAILIIILCHMGDFWGIRYFTPLGGIGVAIFLIISGYGLAESYKKTGLKNYWRKRLITSYFPYIIIRAVIIFIKILMGSRYRVIDTLLGFLLIKKLHVYDWYMSYLFIWYFIFFVINHVKTSDKNKFSLFIVVSIIMFFVCKMNLSIEQSVSFLFGIYLSYYYKNDSKKFLKGSMFMVTGIVALALKQVPAIRGLDTTNVWCFIQLVNKFCIACGIIFCLHSIINVINLKMFYYIGVISFELYLVHAYIIPILKNGNLKNHVVFIVSSFLLAWMANRIIKVCTSFLKRRLLVNEKSSSQTISNS